MKKLSLMTISLLVVFFIAGCSETPDATDISNVKGKTMTVYYSPSCSCCKSYVDYLESNGVDVNARSVSRSRLNLEKNQHNLPETAWSCHTATIDDYVVEGHVPLEAVDQLLAERPDDVKGITIPGMPQNAPGMGGPIGDYLDVKAISKQGSLDGVYTQVYY